MDERRRSMLSACCWLILPNSGRIVSKNLSLFTVSHFGGVEVAVPHEGRERLRPEGLAHVGVELDVFFPDIVRALLECVLRQEAPEECARLDAVIAHFH